MSRQERLVIIFLILCVVIGTGVSFYKNTHLAQIQVVPSAITKSGYIKGKTNINTAGPQELASLPGIGPSLAKKIVNFRQENGLFILPEDITKVSGIGKSKYESIKDLVTTENEPRSSFE